MKCAVVVYTILANYYIRSIAFFLIESMCAILHSVFRSKRVTIRTYTLVLFKFRINFKVMVSMY